MMRARHSSKSCLCSGSLVWCTFTALSPGTNFARRRLARSPANAPTLPPPAGGGGLGRGLILELPDLFRRPARTHADQRVRDRAFGKIIELPELAMLTGCRATSSAGSVLINSSATSLQSLQPWHVALDPLDKPSGVVRRAG